MGGVCGDRVKTIRTIFVAEKFKFFCKKSVFRRTIQKLFYTSYKMAISVQKSKPHVEGELFKYRIIFRSGWKIILHAIQLHTQSVCMYLHCMFVAVWCQLRRVSVDTIAIALHPLESVPMYGFRKVRNHHSQACLLPSLQGLWVCWKLREAITDPVYMSRKIRKFRTDKFDTWNKRKFWLMQLM